MCVCDELHKMKRNYKKESRQEQFLYDKMHKENYRPFIPKPYIMSFKLYKLNNHWNRQVFAQWKLRGKWEK